MKPVTILLALAIPLALGGCLARTALDVATAPVKIAGRAADLATTSQSEADEKRGREIRKQEERLGKLQRIYDAQMARCQKGSSNDCRDAADTYSQMQDIIASLPASPPRR